MHTTQGYKECDYVSLQVKKINLTYPDGTMLLELVAFEICSWNWCQFVIWWMQVGKDRRMKDSISCVKVTTVDTVFHKLLHKDKNKILLAMIIKVLIVK